MALRPREFGSKGSKRNFRAGDRETVMSQGGRTVQRVNRGAEEGPGTLGDKRLSRAWSLELGNISERLITLTPYQMTVSFPC